MGVSTAGRVEILQLGVSGNGKNGVTFYCLRAMMVASYENKGWCDL